MPQPDKIVIDYDVAGWAIEYGKFDVGDVGPEYVNFRAVVYWEANTHGQALLSNSLRGVPITAQDEIKCKTFKEAMEFLLKEIGAKI